MAAFVALATAATAASVDPGHSLVGERRQYQGLLALVAFACAFLGARAGVTSERARRSLVAGVTVAAVPVALYALAQQSGVDPFWRGLLDKGRIFSTFGQANALAAWLVIALPCALSLVLVTSGPRRRLAAAAAAIVTIVIALTLSRGAYLGAIVAAAVFVGLAPAIGRRRAGQGEPSTARETPMPAERVRHARAAVALVAVAGLMTIAVGAAPPGRAVLERVVARASVLVDPRESSAASHLDLWAVGAAIALDHPLLGVGPEIFPAVVPSYRDRVLSPDRAQLLARFRAESPHNVPVALAVGVGLPALAAYLALVAAALLAGTRALLRDARRGSTGSAFVLAAIVAAIAGHLVTDLFMTAETAGSWTSWAFLGVLIASGRGE